MFFQRPCLTAFPLAGLIAISASVAAAPANTLRPHQAIYDLTLAGPAENVLAVEGRIAYTLTMRTCGEYQLDYRFAARFHKDGETTTTDQRVRSSERNDGKAYDFETHTYVDGLDVGSVLGTAKNSENSTEIALREPVERSVTLPLSRFPLDHTEMLIEKALSGARFVESTIYDGDPEAEPDNITTATAIILQAQGGERPMAELADLRRWTIDESYFNADSDENGLPIFRSRYRLYENGVSDDLLLDFGDYTLKGRLSELTYLTDPGCR